MGARSLATSATRITHLAGSALLPTAKLLRNRRYARQTIARCQDRSFSRQVPAPGQDRSDREISSERSTSGKHRSHLVELATDFEQSGWAIWVRHFMSD